MQHGAYAAGTKLELEPNEATIHKHTEIDRAEQRLHGEICADGADIQLAASAATETAISQTRRTGETVRPQPDAKPVTPPLIISSKEFSEKFTPPDYLIDGLAQRRFLYSLTGNTGAGKTAIALRLAAHVALGKPLGDYEVEKGRVLYFAGENPDDLRMRWIALSEHLGFDRNSIDVHFIVGADKEISKIKDQMEREVSALDGVSLIIVDTSAAYFNGDECDDENDNVQAGNHARMFRSLTTLPGGPCVIVLTHPAKKTKNDGLVPRGGGAFVNEVDGNLTVKKQDALSEVHWQTKYRGPDFAPIFFELVPVRSIALKDSKGRLIPSVIAVPISDEDQAAIEAGRDQDGNSILALMKTTPNLSLLDLAKALDWNNAKGEPDKRRVQTGMQHLTRQGLATIDAGSKRYKLTKEGKKIDIPPVH